MKAYIYNGIKDIELKELPMPECGDKDIIVKNLCAGICGSDVAAYYHGGDNVFIFKGFEFGHEMVSEVVQVGKDVKGFKQGDRVYPFPSTCKNDPMRSATVGGFSEYLSIINAEEGYNAFHIDESISNKEASLIEPMTVGHHAAIQSRAKANDHVLIFGSGIIGLSAAIALRYLGVKDIMITDLSDYRLALAKKMGFSTCNSSKESLDECVEKELGVIQKQFGGNAYNVDVYIDAAGVKSVIETFETHAKQDARLCVVGVHHEPRAINLQGMMLNQLTICGSLGYDYNDLKEVLEIIKSKQFDLEGIISDEYPHSELEAGIQKSADPNSSVKVVINYELN